MERSSRTDLRQTACSELPTWNELIKAYQGYDEARACVDSIQKLKNPEVKRRLRLVTRLAAKALAGVVRRPNFGDMLESDWDDWIDLAAEQVARNILVRGRMTHASPLDSRSAGVNTGSIWKHRFNQLPCTNRNLRERVRMIQECMDKRLPVLLLGDDDLLGIELAKSGFESVTVIDIDETVINAIRKKNALSGHGVEARVHDLRVSPPAELVRDYALVFMDPPCTTEGVILFLNAALQFCANSSRTQFLVCTHAMSQMKGGLAELGRFFVSNGLQVRWFDYAFAVYPLSREIQVLLCMVRRILQVVLIRSGVTLPKDSVPRFFVSDVFLLSAKFQ